jgi:uncharacterized protein
MKYVLIGGSGHVGSAIRRHLSVLDHEVVVVSRTPGPGQVGWDGVNQGEWVAAIEGADVVINLAGRTVNCRYSEENLRQMMDSRVLSTRAVGVAISRCERPPKVWIQSSTATIYAHRFDGPNDEATGILGGEEPGAPYKWNASIAIAKAWEAELWAAETAETRKVAIRSAMTMTADRGSVFDVFVGLARRGLSGRQGSGRQYVSWIHERDFVRSLDWIVAHEELAGAINLSSPNPLPQAEFARVLREAVGVKFGLPAAAWMIEIGTWAMRTESELVLKSRRVVPGRLIESGFRFEYPDWAGATRELVTRLDRI